MFSLVKYNDITPCIRGSEHLTSILDRGGVSKLWLNSEHIFLCANEGPNFYAFDVVPQLKWRRAVQPTLKDCVLDEIPEPVVQVIWDSSNPSLVFIVTKNGTANIWEFLRPSHEWLKHKTIQLSNAKGSQIIDVKYHEESSNLFWCEKRGFAIDAYCVCYRSVNIQDASEKVKIGSTQAVLHNCPLVNVHVFNNGVCIQPCQVYLERILILWTSGCVNLQAVVVDSGKVQESVKGLSDFRDITTSLVGSWIAKDDSKTWLGITAHGSSGDLLLLNKNGTVIKLSINSSTVNLTPVCNFKLPSNIHENFEDLTVFSNRLIFGLLDCNSCLFIYDIISGKLLQTLQEFTSGSVRVIPGINCKHLTTVFWSSSRIWKLNCKSLNELVKKVTTEGGDKNYENLGDETRSKASLESEMMVEVQEVLPRNRVDFLAEVMELLDVVKWLYLFGLKHSATVLLLEHVVSCTKRGESIPVTTLQLLKRLEKEVVRNPGVLLTLFQGDLGLKEECRSELKSFLNEIDQATVPSEYMTPLNLKILPFLRELYERWNEQIVVPSVDLGQLSTVLEDSAYGVVDAAVRAVIAGATDALCLEKMGILSLHAPAEAVNAFVKDGKSLLLRSGDEVNNIAEVLRAELNDRRWKRRSSPENATVIGVLFRLLYKEHPEGLLDVLDMAEEIVGTSKDEGTLQDLKENVRDFMLDFLPNVWSEEESNLKRIKVHAQILDRLGLNREALAIFLERQLWNEAVEFYVDVTRSSTDTLEVSQLYQILLSSLLRGSGTTQSELLSRVFEMKPEGIEAQNLFKLCLRNVSESSMQEVFKKECLTVGEARKTILKFLPKT